MDLMDYQRFAKSYDETIDIFVRAIDTLMVLEELNRVPVFEA